MADGSVLELPLPDQRARDAIRTALDVNLLVEAGAGSGKTTELIARMVALVETGAATSDQIAAVTFTRKAAAELRERFQTRLEQRIGELRTTSDVGDLALERLRHGLDDIDRAFVGTIHAFCARLLGERPLEIGLDPAFEELALEERLTLRRRFWQAYLERLTRDADPVLEELARAGLRPATLYGLFDKLVENPDVVFPAEAAEPGTGEELEATRAALEELVDRAWELMPEREPEKGWDSLQRKMRTLRFTRDVTGWREPADFYEALSQICKPGRRGHSIVQKRWKNKEHAKALCADVDAFGVGDTPARRLLERWYTHRYALAIRLARHAAEEFAAYRLRIGRLDFQDLLTLTAKLLRTRPAVRRDLGERYRRLLVDEFQDTDPLQAEIMMLLASDPEAGEGEPAGGVAPEPAAWRRAVPRPGALFVVGDPKQSIYRFRRADIQLYGLVKDRLRELGKVVELTTNFRSRPAIGDLVNELFAREGYFPAEETAEQAAFEPLNTRPALADVPSEGVFGYRVTPSESNQAAAARDDARRIASWIRGRVDSGEREPGDFLILTRVKSRLDVYARALEAYGLPVQVTGAGVGVEEELRELQVVLECMIDPTNPVRVVAALVGLFFGIDYERLVDHRLEGGGLDVMRPGERGAPDVLAALRTLHAWWRTSSRDPADVFVSRLVSELGLLPYAASGELGTLRAGALVYAVDAVRAAALAGDASLPGALAALQSALELPEAEAPLEPGRPHVVRLMNLHQAKGLEGTVVILADPSGAREHAPEMHVTRSADGSAVGHLRVTEAVEGFGADKVLAVPADWDAKEAAERRFEAAEGVRLLYVAVTRARQELLVARWMDSPDASPWRALHPWLDERAPLLELEPAPPPPRASVEVAPEEVRQREAQAAERLARRGAATYAHESVTELVKTADASDGRRREGEPRPEGDFRGFSWGSAVHGALAAAVGAPDPEALRATCRDLLVENARPLDDHGEPVELRELEELVRAVQGSELWARALRAERMHAEVSFAAPGDVADGEETSGAVGADHGGGRERGTSGSTAGAEGEGRSTRGGVRPQLDLFGGVPPVSREAEGRDGGAEAAAPPRRVLEGVIDLVFREPDGWVVADYKTDVGTDPDFPIREAAYRRQVELYAEAWARLSGEPVKERVLFFTTQGRLESW
ncbi:MAG TPA: UvrD-helicase domain-containing protein [Longimicrobiales bacterium]|nr:UvrD-helicase domain-containing protein [Longimicrobiales bacterium]